MQRARTPLALKDGTSTGYGYGWFVDNAAPQPVLRHDGQTAGFTAEYARYPGRDVAVVVFANACGAQVRSIAPEVEAAYRRRGALRSVVPVGPGGGVKEAARPAYRVVLEHLTRLMRFEFDDEGRVRDFSAEDE